MGRLLIALLLAQDKVLSRPLHYRALRGENRADYYERLQTCAGTARGSWLVFYLKGVGEVADQAAATAWRATALFAQHREKYARWDGRVHGGARTA